MRSRDVLDLLAASGPFAGYVERVMLYGQFVGSWDVEATWYGGEEVRRSTGEWHFAWVLGGRGLQDVLYGAGAPPDRFGTTLRCYDPEKETWHIAWMQPASGEFVSLQGRPATTSCRTSFSPRRALSASAGGSPRSRRTPFAGSERC